MTTVYMRRGPKMIKFQTKSTSMIYRIAAFERWPSFLGLIILLMKFATVVDCFAFSKGCDQRRHYSQHFLQSFRGGDECWYFRSDIMICSASFEDKEPPQKFLKSDYIASTPEDPYNSFPIFDRILFKLFSASVTAEMQKSSDKEPKNYRELMDLINEMTKTRSIQKVNDQGKNMLKRLFPPWLLTQYKWMFAAPFPEVFTVTTVKLKCLLVTVTWNLRTTSVAVSRQLEVCLKPAFEGQAGRQDREGESKNRTFECNRQVKPRPHSLSLFSFCTLVLIDILIFSIRHDTPIVQFSAWMNAYVTHWTTNWLMGNSTIYDLGEVNYAIEIWCDVMWCDMIWYDMIRYDIKWHCVSLCLLMSFDVFWCLCSL